MPELEDLQPTLAEVLGSRDFSIPQSVMLSGRPFEQVENEIRLHGGAGFSFARSIDQGRIAWAAEVALGIPREFATKMQTIYDAERSGERIDLSSLMQETGELKRWAQAQEILKLVTERDKDGNLLAPVTAQMAQDPRRLVYFKDDLTAAFAVERLMTRSSGNVLEVILSDFDDGARSMFRGGLSAIQAGMNIPDMLSNMAASTGVFGDEMKAQLEEYSKLPTAMRGGLRKLTGDVINSALFAPLDTPVELSWWSQLRQAVPQFLAMMYAGHLGYAAYGLRGAQVAAGSTMGTLIFGDTQQRLARLGVSPHTAAYSGLANAAGQAVLEGVGAGKMISLGRTLTGTGAVRRGLFATAGAALWEGGTEGAQVAPEMITEMMARIAEAKTADEVEEIVSDYSFQKFLNQALLEGSIGTALGSAGAVSVGLNVYAGERQIARYHEIHKAVVAELEAMKKPVYAPEVERALTEYAESGGTPTFFLFQEDEARQTLEAELDDFIETAGIGREVEQARSENLPVRVPVSKLAHMTSDMWAKIEPHVTYDATQDPVTEEDAQARLADQVTRQRIALGELLQGEVIPDALLELQRQLTGTEIGGKKIKAKDARAYTAVLQALGSIAAERRGITLEKWLEEKNITLETGLTQDQMQALGEKALMQAGGLQEVSDLVAKAGTMEEKQRALDEWRRANPEKVKPLEGGAQDAFAERYLLSGVVDPSLTSQYATDLPNMAAKFAEDMQGIGAPRPGGRGFGVVRVYPAEGATWTTQNEYTLPDGARPVAEYTPAEVRAGKHLELVSPLTLLPDGTLAGQTKGRTKYQGDTYRYGAFSQEQRGGQWSNVVRLAEMANPTTFLHEVYHLVEADLEALIREGNADDATVSDWETLLAFSDDYDLRAEAFVEYLKEGRAPSAKLHSIFLHIANIIRRIVTALAVNNQKLSPALVDVFDRLMATESEINAAKEFYASDRFADIAAMVKTKIADDAKRAEETAERKDRRDAADAALGITDDTAEADKVIARREAARKAADEKAFELAQQVYIQANMPTDAEIEAQARAQLEAMPEIQAIHLLEEAGVKLGYYDVEQAVGTDLAEALLKKRRRIPIVKDDRDTYGLTVLATQLEVDPRTLVQGLIALKTDRQLLRAFEAQIRIAERDKLRQDFTQYQATPGDEIYHSDKRLETLESELALLELEISLIENRRLAQAENRAWRAQLKEEVRRVLEGKTIREAQSYLTHAQREAYHSNKCFEAAQRGKWDKAREHKRQQIFHHEMVLQSIALRDEVRALEKAAMRVVKAKPETYSHDNVILAQLVLEPFGYKTAAPDPEVKKAMREQGNAAKAYVESVMEAYGFPDYPVARWTLEQNPETNPLDLKIQKLRDLVDTGRWLIEQGRNELDDPLTLGLTEHATVGDAVASVMPTIESWDVPKEKKDTDLLTKVEETGTALMSPIERVSLWLRRIDRTPSNSPEIGPLEKLFSLALSKIAGRHQGILGDRIQPRIREINKVFRAATKRMEKTLGKQPSVVTGTNGVVVPRAVNEEVATKLRALNSNYWVPSEILCAVLNSGTEKGVATLRGYGFEDEHIAALRSLLTAEEYAAVQELWDTLNSLFVEMDETHYKVFKKRTVKEEAMSFTTTTADGQTVTMVGGYYPTHHDFRLLSEKQKAARDTEMLIKQNTRGAAIMPKANFAKNKTGAPLPPKLDLRVIQDHINDVTWFISFAPVLKDLDRVTKDKGFELAMTSRFGAQRYTWIRKYLENLANPPMYSGNIYDRVMVKNKAMVTLYVFAAAVKSMLKQPGSVGLGAERVGAGYVLGGVGRIIRHPKATAKQILSEPYMRARLKTPEADIADMVATWDSKQIRPALRIGERELTWKDVGEGLTSLMGVGDAAGAWPVWIGAYNQYVQAHADMDPTALDTAAREYASYVVSQTAPSFRAIDRVELQRDPARLRSVLAMFGSYTMLYGQHSRNAMSRFYRGEMGVGELFDHVVYAQLVPLFMYIMVEKGWAYLVGKDDDDDKTLWDELAWYGVNQLVSGYPIANQIPRAVEFGNDDRFLDLPILRPPRDFIGPLIEGRKWSLGEEHRFLQALGEAASMRFGVPVPEAIRNIRGFYEAHIEGDEQ